ncbi:GH25 family lysozyme [Isoptericola sp. b515]|uniref:GH25 family lysozyme n=1 Tax=Isoptericola sp. b515 TaxID=3064652 RepID=UPI0027134F30|nr:GH25 family lysozyme [Isoptericola sp. b515]MDO8147477.1 GH25 family lysozyme [Isoptericola sp. b515]
MGARAGRRRRWLRWTTGVLAGLVLAAGVLAVLVWNGIVWPNRFLVGDYEVRGVDVSAYQGEIDWPVLAAQDLDFAFMKATEGSRHVDERFAANWAGARNTDLVVGAYHFMSFESAGESQAAHVVAQVPAEPGTLPPVVDVEYYGAFAADPPSGDELRGILDPLLADLEAHYGAPPIIYTTQEIRSSYLGEDYDRYPLWIRSVALTPDLPRHDWEFWQYSDRDHLDGYDGEEEHIDMNVFDGSLAELRALTLD